MAETDWNIDLRSRPDFQQWLEQSLSFFTYDKFQHTKMSVPIQQQRIFRYIRSVLDTKLQYPTILTVPPLRIYIFGGSVTTGHECLENTFDIPTRKDGSDNGRHGSADDEVKLCAWPGRLQDMLDTLFGKGIIEIINMATGGAQTDMSTAVLNFGLLPHPPDIIVWDHGTNDVLAPIEGENLDSINLAWIRTDAIFNKLQAFYQGIVHLPKVLMGCNKTNNQNETHSDDDRDGDDYKDQPLVILLDTFLGRVDKQPLVQQNIAVSTAISKMLLWYPNILGISYANSIRSYIYSHLGSRHIPLSLLGSKGLFNHPGMMYHITVAWTVLFNFLYALHDNCTMESNVQQEQQQLMRQGHDLSAIVVVSPFDNNSSEFQNSNMNNSISIPDGVQIPELNNDLRILDIPLAWDMRIISAQESAALDSCSEQQHGTTTAKENYTATTAAVRKYSSLQCHYARILNRVLRIESPRDIHDAMNFYMIQNNGWTSFHEDSKTSPGWVTKSRRGSNFILFFDAIPSTIQSLTLVYMQSYSEKRYNSTLQIDCTFTNTRRNTDITTTASKSLSNNYGEGRRDREGKYLNKDTDVQTETSSLRHFVSGYHEDKSSILTQIKLPLPVSQQSSAASGTKALQLNFQLINGESFKIAGIAIC